MVPILLVLLSVVVASPAFAQTGSCIQMGFYTSCMDSSGRQATIIDMGNGFQTYQDSRGNSGSIIELGPNFKQYSITPGTLPALPPPVFNSPGEIRGQSPFAQTNRGQFLSPTMPGLPAMPPMPGFAPMPPPMQ